MSSNPAGIPSKHLILPSVETNEVCMAVVASRASNQQLGALFI